MAIGVVEWETTIAVVEWAAAGDISDWKAISWLPALIAWEMDGLPTKVAWAMELE